MSRGILGVKSGKQSTRGASWSPALTFKCFEGFRAGVIPKVDKGERARRRKINSTTNSRPGQSFYTQGGLITRIVGFGGYKSHAH